jgi:hypothetical protein
VPFRDGRSHLNYAVYHDRYQRTPDGWRFAERIYGSDNFDTTPLAGSAPEAAAGAPLTSAALIRSGAGLGLRGLWR